MNKHIKISILITILTVIYSLSPLFGQEDPTGDIKITTWNENQVPTQGEVLLDVRISVPENHYIYLEHVDPPGYSILTEITLGDVKGIVLKEVIKPGGIKKGEDMVLKGTGIFSLKLIFRKGHRAGDKLSLPYKVMVQMCDEKTGVCYPPYTFEKKMSLKFVENNFKAARSVREEGIDWVYSHKKGAGKAENAGRNMFVLITAPTWCGPCQYLEATTLRDKKVIEFLNDNFIPVKIRDTINGERNPELWTYDFAGYPTYLVATPGKEVLYQDAGTISAAGLLSELLEFENEEKETYIDNTPEQLPEEHFSMNADIIKNFNAVFRYRKNTGCAILNDGTYYLFNLLNNEVPEGYPGQIEDSWRDLKAYRDNIISAFTYGNGDK